MMPAKKQPADAAKNTQWDKAGQVAKKKKKKRTLRWIVLSLLAVILLAVLLTPTVVSRMLPGIVAEKGSAAINGRVELGSARIAWIDGQRLGNLAVYDDSGEEVAMLDIEVPRTLVGILLAGGNPGEVRLSGNAQLVRAESGATNVEGLIKPGAESPEPVKLPGALRGTSLVIDTLNVTVKDRMLLDPDTELVAKGIAGKLTLPKSGPITATLDASLTRNAKAQPPKPAGTIDLDATITDAVAADGTLTPDAASIDATLTVDELAVAMIDLIANTEGRLVDALGETLSIGLTANGTSGKTDATLTARSVSVVADVPLSLDLQANRVRTREAAVITLETAQLTRIIEDREALLGPDAATYVKTYPRVTITLADVDAAIPSGEDLDLRGSSATVTATIGAAEAVVQVPGGGTNSVALPESIVELRAADLADGATLTGRFEPKIDGGAGGTLTIDMTATDVLDESGAPRSDRLPTLRGELSAQRLALAVAQPFAEAFGVVLQRDVGPTLDLRLAAEPGESGTTTSITLNGSAANLKLSGDAQLDGSRISAPGEALTLRIDKLGPALAAIIEKNGIAGVSVGQTGPFTLTVRDVTADTAEIAAGRVAGARAQVRAELPAGRVRVQPPGESANTPKRIDLADFILALDLNDLTSGVGITADGRASVDGQPAGTLAVNLRTSSVVTADGSLRTGVPASIEGTAAIEKLDTGLLAPFVGQTGIVVAEDIGPSAELKLTAAAMSGEDGTTRVAVDMTSAAMELSGGVLLTADRLRTTDRGLLLTHKSPYRVASRFVPKETAIAVGRTGFLQLAITGLNVPLDPDSGAPDLPASAAKAELSIRNGEVTVAGNALSMAAIDLGAVLKPGDDPRVTINADGTSPEGPLTAEGAFSIREAFAATTGGSPIPVGKLQIIGIPPALADLAGAPVQTASGPVALGQLASTALGPRTNMVLETKPAGSSDGIAADVRLNGPFLKVTAAVTAAPVAAAGASGPAWQPSALAAEGTYTSTPNQLARLLGWFAPEQARMLTLRENAVIAFDARLNDAKTIKASMKTDGIAIGEIVIPPADPQAPGAQPTRIPASTIVMNALADLPVAALNGRGSATLDANLNARTADRTTIARIEAKAKADLNAGAPAGPMEATVNIADVSTAFADAMLGSPGLVSGAVGETLAMNLNASGAFAPAAAGGAGSSLDRLTATLAVTASKLRTGKPLEVAVTPARITLSKPAELTWEPDAAWLSAFLEPTDGSQPALTVQRLAPVTLAVEKLNLPRGGSATGAPEVGVRLTSNKLRLQPATGDAFEYADLRAMVNSDVTQPGRINVDASIANSTGGKVVALTGNLAELTNAQGVFDPKNATLSADLTIDKLATALIDALANGNGQIVGILGLTANATAKIENLPRQNGTVRFEASTDHANLAYSAVVRPGASAAAADRLVLRNEFNASLHELRDTYGFDLASVIPVFAKVTKDPEQHEPASAIARVLAIPVDGNPKDVRLEATLDPGEVSFEINPAVTAFLKAVGQRGAGIAGQRIEPVNVSMRDGVLTYENLKLPVGEFVFQSKGSRDLVNQTEDLWLYIPAGAVAGDVIGGLTSVPGFGGDVNETAMLPFRRTGPIGADNKWEPQPGAMVEQLFSPKKLLEEGLKKGLEDLLPGREP